MFEVIVEQTFICFTTWKEMKESRPVHWVTEPLQASVELLESGQEWLTKIGGMSKQFKKAQSQCRECKRRRTVMAAKITSSSLPHPSSDDSQSASGNEPESEDQESGE
jgi:hypothetical protein